TPGASFDNVQARYFDTGATDEFTSAWNDPLWTKQSGDFTLAGGQAKGGASQDNLALVTDTYLTDSIVKVYVTLAGNGSRGGVVARYQGPQDFYAGVLEEVVADSTTTYYARIYHFHDGIPILLTSSASLTGLPTQPRVRFEVLGNTLTLWVGGLPRISTTDDT